MMAIRHIQTLKTLKVFSNTQTDLGLGLSFALRPQP